MSYILEALRRADEERERERGAVPSIHSQPAASAPDETRPPRQQRLLLGVIAALLLVLVALLAWYLMRHEGPRTVAVAPVEPAAPVQAVPAPPPAEPAAAVQAVQPPPEPPVQALQQPAPQAPPPAAAIGPVSPVAPVLPPAPVRPPIQPRTPPSSPVSPPLPNASLPPAAVPAAEARIYSTSELPEDVRRDLPKLVIGGAMYSDNPGNRMLIINSQIFHEGDKLTPDLLLQEIKLKSAVLKYKGYRYAVNY